MNFLAEKENAKYYEGLKAKFFAAEERKEKERQHAGKVEQGVNLCRDPLNHEMCKMFAIEAEIALLQRRLKKQKELLTKEVTDAELQGVIDGLQKVFDAGVTPSEILKKLGKEKKTTTKRLGKRPRPDGEA